MGDEKDAKGTAGFTSKIVGVASRIIVGILTLIVICLAGLVVLALTICLVVFERRTRGLTNHDEKGNKGRKRV